MITPLEQSFTAWADREFGPAPDTTIPQTERFASYWKCWQAAQPQRTGNAIRDAFATLNQCDGCAAGMPINYIGNHVGADGRPYMGCTRDRYAQQTDVARLVDAPPGFIKPDSDTQVFFYEQDFYVLSNFSAFNLHWKGRTFSTSEHAYHWEKFDQVPDAWNCAGSIARQILEASSAHEAFKIAEVNKHRRRPDWDDVKVDIMRGILRAKVQQHEYVRRKLLATGARELIEDSWRDDFWGWGPNRDGQNMLGKLWMEVRNELRVALAAKGGDHA